MALPNQKIHPNVAKKEIPSSVEAEKALLSVMVIDNSILPMVFEKIQEDHFHFTLNKYIFEAIKSIAKESPVVDYIKIIDQIKRRGQEEVVTKEYILSLGDIDSSPYNVEEYIDILHEKLRYRQILFECNNIMTKVYAQEMEVKSLFNEAQANILELSREDENRGFEHIRGIIKTSMLKLDKLSKNKKDITGTSTGYNVLDNLTKGWQNTDLIIIAGRPSMGKTAFCLNIARNAAFSYFQEAEAAKNQPLDEGEVPHVMKSVAFFSLEMGSEQLVNRLVSIESMIDGTKIRTGKLFEQDWIQLMNSVDNLSNLPIYIDDSPGINMYELRAKCRRLKARHNVGLIIIDYLQLMEPENARNENRQQEIAKISRQLKMMAKDLNVPIIALSQLSRALESRNDKRPMLSDLRESGSIEQDADIVGFVHRPEYYKIQQFDDGVSTENIAEIIIGKHRNGPIGDVRLTFLKNFGKFAEVEQFHTMEPEYQQEPSDPGF